MLASCGGPVGFRNILPERRFAKFWFSDRDDGISSLGVYWCVMADILATLFLCSSHVYSLIPIRTLLTAQLAKCFEGREVLALALENTLCGGPNEVNKPYFYLFGLRPNGDRTFAISANEDTRTCYGFESGFGAFLL